MFKRWRFRRYNQAESSWEEFGQTTTADSSSRQLARTWYHPTPGTYCLSAWDNEADCCLLQQDGTGKIRLLTASEATELGVTVPAEHLARGNPPRDARAILPPQGLRDSVGRLRAAHCADTDDLGRPVPCAEPILDRNPRRAVPCPDVDSDGQEVLAAKPIKDEFPAKAEPVPDLDEKRRPAKRARPIHNVPVILPQPVG